MDDLKDLNDALGASSPYDLRASPGAPVGKKRGAKFPVGFLAAVVVILIFAGLAFVVVRMVASHVDSGGAAAAAEADASGQSTQQRELTSFVGNFLMSYFCYSYTVYEQAVQRAMTQMTPQFQAVYQAAALDRNFVNMLTTKQVSTDAFRINPGSIEYGEQGTIHFVQLSGTMTYTTGVNGAQAEWPTTVKVEVWDTPQGFKVNDVTRLE